MRIQKILTGGGPPVSEQHAFDVRYAQGLLQKRVVAQIDLADRQVVRGAPIGVHLPQLFGIQRCSLGYGLHHGQASSGCNSSNRTVASAITDSSSVRITRTATGPASADTNGAPCALRASSNWMPRYCRPSQTRARTAAAISTIPPANTNVSTPPSAAANAPTHC